MNNVGNKNSFNKLIKEASKQVEITDRRGNYCSFILVEKKLKAAPRFFLEATDVIEIGTNKEEIKLVRRGIVFLIHV